MRNVRRIFDVKYERANPNSWTISYIPNYVTETNILSSIGLTPVTRIAKYACAYSDLKELIVPASVHKIESRAFYNCCALEKVWIKGACALYRDAFEQCTALKVIYFSENILTIHPTVVKFFIKNNVVLKCHSTSNVWELASVGCIIEPF